MSVLPDAVCWHEGMQLLPQHFQLQGLRAEALAARTGQACNPWFWGVTALELDPSALCAGQVRVLHLEAILPDGLPVSVQAGVDAPLEFDLETALAAAEGPLLNVHLAVSPLWRAGQLLPLKGRLQSRVGAPLPDLASGEHPEPITVWRVSLRLVGDDGKADSVCLPLLRVAKEGGAYVSLPYVPPTPLVLPESPLGRRVQSLCARAREKALFLGGRLRLAQQAGNQDDRTARGRSCWCPSRCSCPTRACAGKAAPGCACCVCSCACAAGARWTGWSGTFRWRGCRMASRRPPSASPPVVATWS
ncbi:type VI secretion protein [Pseudomonas aeruginosa VRFPA09]|nr:type VI secretion protein [Pseudomonas aeruginosa VRFPA09]